MGNRATSQKPAERTKKEPLFLRIDKECVSVYDIVSKVENVQIARFQPSGQWPDACETRFVLYEVQTTAANAAICGVYSPQS